MLKQRILSACILLPLPVLALYFGSPWFELLCAVVLTVMGWEWEKLILKRFSVLGMLIAVTGVCSVFILDLDPLVAWILPAVMTVVLYVAAKKQQLEHKKLFAFGMIYSVYPIVALAFMLQNYGFISTIWLIGTVWAMDTGAYLFGKTIGGPKMCPKISPKKTWAGLIGGMLASAAWGAACAGFGGASYEPVMIVSAVLGAVSQGGDLFESWIKRYLGVKDSSDLIPGHGGIFDRTDALLAVAPIVVIIIVFIYPELNFWG
ncbi:MAG: phosphatidate cytidylyltransferase [Alphaproteobacteria bacterium]|nr:phosphatidate cytidylyltransferase [Alphaproteobacteria bacterium]